MSEQVESKTVTGGCHCGAVQWQAKIFAPWEVTICNCSICTMKGFVHLFVHDRAADFARLGGGEASDDEATTTYQFGTKTARHIFCSTCGIASYYIPRSHPDGVSLNFNCVRLSDEERGGFVRRPFDGRDWEKNIGGLNPDLVDAQEEQGEGEEEEEEEG